MSLPVSSYEELLARVRSLTHETIQLQRELTTPISNSAPSASLQLDHNENERLITPLVAATGGTDDCPTGLANDTKANFTPHESPPGCELHRPNSFQRPLLSHADEHRSWSMSHRKSSSRRERSRTSDTVGSAPNVRSSSALNASKPRALGEGQEGLRSPRLTKDKEQGPPEPKEQDDRTDGSTTSTQGSDGAGAMTGSVSEEGQNIASLYHGTWPVERGLWHSGPTMLGGSRSLNQDACSVMSFSCSVGSCGGSGVGGSSQRTFNQQQLGAKVEMVYSLLSMLGTHDREDMSRTLLAMSSSPDSCQAMRQSGCLPLLVQFLHVPDQPAETRLRASQALHNVVHSQADDKRGRREARVLRLLEQVRDYCDSLRQALQEVALAQESAVDLERPCILDDMERHPGPTIAALMKLSFDEEHRHAMCQLGGLHAIAELIQLDHEAHGSITNDQYCVTLRRYAGMALTNLTFGDGTNKALLCSFRHFMKTLVAQLCSPSEDLRQVTASVLRNLSWRADGASKQMLREVSAVPGLMHAAMEGKKEATLKSILSALWNLSAHCTMNKVDICAVEGALGFLVEMLSYNAPSKTLAIVENAGGILRNISSHIAIREDYRSMLRRHNCLQVLLQQLKSPSLTIVSNACGTLWNLSARCPEDQRALWDMGAVNMLRSLVHSKHKMISMGSSAALKNLLGAKPNNNYPLDSTAKSLGLPALPSLYVRKQKALEQELDQSLAETCDNIEPSTSPSGLRDDKFIFSPTERFSSDGRHRLFRCHYQNQARHKTHVSRSDSRDSVTSTLSDTVYERITRNNDVLSHTLPNDGIIHRDSERSSSIHGTLDHTEPSNFHLPDNVASDKKFLRRYSNSMKQREDKRVLPLEVNDDNVLESTLAHSTEELGSPYSRLGHSDEGYVEKTTSEKVQECSSDLNTLENQGAQKVNKTHKSYDAQRGEHSSFTSYPYNSDPHYQNRPNTSTYPRNKFSDLEIDSGMQEEPVDYSLKYKEQSQAANKSLEAEKVIEVKIAGEIKIEDSRSNQNDLGRGYALRNQASVSTSKNIKMNVVYGDYAETDLDQPTDYSLKYAEEDEELEFAKISEGEGVGEPVQFYEGSSPILEDTLKTYYTEGTPYETPYNFSTATSMSDLRCEQTALPEKKEDKESYPTSDLNAENFHEGSTEKEFQMKYLPSVTQPPLQGVQSGLMSPEKPVQYCEEGTPGLFSRVSSLSSLNSIPVLADKVDVKQSEVSLPLSKDQATVTNSDKDEPKEGKVVTFGSTDHYAEETPLMFSRCSSLGSLSSFEQHSIHDDRSSVISDFSRRTSGIVSPSELPDSPTQSVPSSPHQNKTHSFPSHLPDNLARGHSSSRPAARSSVFEDDITAFKEEDTPVEFSRATSLSSLTIDDEPKISNDSVLKEVSKPAKTAIPAGIHHVRRAEREKEEGMEKQDVEKEKRDLSDCCELAPVSEGEEDDEDMLAACITIGMQGGRHKSKTMHPRLSVQGAMRARLNGIPLKSSPMAVQRQPPPCTSTQDTGTKSTAVDLPGACEDALLTYCTEGTPATTSHAGSHSDLSILSFPCDTDENESRKREQTQEPTEVEETDKPPALDLERPDFSDDSSNFSGDNDNILAECIQSGMPKARTPRRVLPQPGTVNMLDSQRHKAPIRRPLQFPTRVDRALRSPKEESSASSKVLSSKDEVEMYTTEGSPCTFSTRSSLSDLTVSTEGGAPGIASCLKRPARSRPLSEGASCDPSLRFASEVPTEDTPLCFATEDTPLEVSHAASLSSLTSADQDEPLFQPKVCNPSDLSWESPSFKVFNKTNSVSEDVVTVLSRNGSLSSLSVDSFGSTEPTASEQALLEQCINSGMPKSKEASKNRLIMVHRTPGRSLPDEQRLEQGMARLSLGDGTKVFNAEHASKNGVNPSAVTSQTGPMAADVGENTRAEGSSTINRQETVEVNQEASFTRASPPAHASEVTRVCIDVVSTEVSEEKIVSTESSHEDFCSGEVDVQVQTGDAMMESLTRQTEELELRCTEKNIENSAMKHSTDRDTWNDDSSPNDVSFPSMSSAPLIGSFRSDGRDNGCLSELVEESDASQSSPYVMTHSSIIQLEAEKLITAFDVEGQNVNYDHDMEYSITSVNSMDLDAIKPPSMMNSLVSLTTSLSEFGELDDRSVLRGRHSKKKAFPAGVMVRRALGNNHNSIDSLLDNVSISSTSQIDNVKPPSAMEELIDLADMENSMISVASITSEVADLAKEGFQSESLGNGDALLDAVPSSASTLQRASDGSKILKSHVLLEIADINVDTGTDTICSDTEICDDPAYTHTIDCEDPAYTHTLDDVDAPELPSDGSRSTPMTSELSSAESTPKKRQKPRLLTPKQKRQLVKDRYRTYTISAEEERQLEKERMLKKENEKSTMVATATDNVNVPSLEGTNEVAEKIEKTTAKITPKQRRLEDRSRFQTRVLEKTSKTESSENSLVEEQSHQTNEKNKVSGIPKFGAKKNIKTLKEKRAAAKERFRTRTLSDDISVMSQGSSSTSSQRDDIPVQPTPEEVESLLQRDANLVICTLNENRGRSESDDMMLDCETLSLVSLESESEHHSKKQALTQQNSLEMLDDGEEKTYVAEPLTPMDDGEDVVELDDAFTEDGEKEPIGPRILKPSSLTLTLDKSSDLANTEAEVSAPKCVRGRRKALYSSPAGRYGQSSATGRAQTTSSGPVRGTRSSTLRQVKPAGASSRVMPVSPTPKTGPKSNRPAKNVNGTLMAPLKSLTANSTPVTPKLTTASKTQRTTSEIVAVEENKELRFKPPERQGTFTKEDGSTLQCMPPLTSPSKTRIPVPASTPTESGPKQPTLPDKKSAGPVPLKTSRSVGSKVKVRQDLTQTTRPRTAPIRLAKTLSLDGDTCTVPQGSKFVTKTKPVVLRECGWVNKKGELKSSVSSQSLQSQRSVSNSSLNSVGSAGAAARVRKKEVTSKIASLWKKVEESKHKQKYVQKDTRVWITSESKQEENVQTNLIRSSTFDGASCKMETLEEKSSNTKTAATKTKKKPGVKSSKLTYTTGGKSFQSGDNFSGNPELDPQSNQKLPVAEVTGTVQPNCEREDIPKVVMRCKSSPKVGESEGDETPQQRLSRLGSFFCMEGAESEIVKPSSTRGNPASAIVSPFNYNPPVQRTPSHIPTLVKPRPDESASESKQNTASMLVTTV